MSDEEKKWNPYKKGQTLVFESSEGKLDSIHIKDVRSQFPDGLGVKEYYEVLNVVGLSEDPKWSKKVEEDILSIQAKTKKRDSRLKFCLSIKTAKFYYSGYYLFNDKLIRKTKKNFTTPYKEFKNITIIESPDNFFEVKNAIKFLYWNNEVGYVGFEKFDGVSWKLKEVLK
ncbi:hypothetical protein AAON49_05095 [Pseudotenacibaculum sp. MALMAid0570]|uniref:hypothetical protein n=1 Tax=Pseudotenacibaculum sp. MALMAid0570 TaxID=3143938 RepID=UPI0032DFC543